MSASLDQIVTDLRTALGLGPISCGSLTLNFDAAGELQTCETKISTRVNKKIDKGPKYSAQ